MLLVFHVYMSYAQKMKSDGRLKTKSIVMNFLILMYADHAGKLYFSKISFSFIHSEAKNWATDVM